MQPNPSFKRDAAKARRPSTLRYTVRLSAYAAAIAVLVLAACSSFVGKKELINELNATKDRARSHINILWYKGTSGDRHFLRHVYAMYGSSDYTVSSNELEIEMPFPYTTDSSKWKRVARIGGAWEASRKHDGVWVLENEGISIR